MSEKKTLKENLFEKTSPKTIKLKKRSFQERLQILSEKLKLELHGDYNENVTVCSMMATLLVTEFDGLVAELQNRRKKLLGSGLLESEIYVKIDEVLVLLGVSKCDICKTTKPKDSKLLCGICPEKDVKQTK